MKTIHLHAIAAAMPMALSLALAIRDAVPGGPNILDMEVKTGSVTVADEVTPDDEVSLPLLLPSHLQRHLPLANVTVDLD